MTANDGIVCGVGDVLTDPGHPLSPAAIRQIWAMSVDGYNYAQGGCARLAHIDDYCIDACQRCRLLRCPA